MSEEEKKAVEIKDSIEILKNTDLDINTIDGVDLRTYNYAVKVVLNQIEEQAKEIEFWKEQADGYSGLAKQIQQDYMEMEQEGIIRYE